MLNTGPASSATPAQSAALEGAHETEGGQLPGSVFLLNEDQGGPNTCLPPGATGFELRAIEFTPGIHSSNKPVCMNIH